MRKYNIEIRIARIFNTYGSRILLNAGRLIGNLLVQSINREYLTIYCDGNQMWRFCFVDDFIDIQIWLIDSLYIGPMNLDISEDLSILKIANLIKNIFINNVNLKFSKEL